MSMAEPRTYVSDDPHGSGPEDGYSQLTMVLAGYDYYLSTHRTENERPEFVRFRTSGSSDPRNLAVIRALNTLWEALGQHSSPTKPEPSKKTYETIAEDGQRYRTPLKGEFIGNSKVKMFGKKTCPNSTHNIPRYSKRRVFFVNQQAAINAGYSPCPRCMK